MQRPCACHKVRMGQTLPYLCVVPPASTSQHPRSGMSCPRLSAFHQTLVTAAGISVWALSHSLLVIFRYLLYCNKIWRKIYRWVLRERPRDQRQDHFYVRHYFPLKIRSPWSQCPSMYSVQNVRSWYVPGNHLTGLVPNFLQFTGVLSPQCNLVQCQIVMHDVR